MNANKKTIALLITILIMIPISLSAYSSGDGTYEEDMVLIDMGNGRTYWISADNEGRTGIETIENALNRLDMEYLSNGNRITDVDGKKDTRIGSVTSSWNYYVWDGSSWKYTEWSASDSYSGGSLAIGHYPTHMKPTETPEFMSSWTMTRGDAEQTGHQTTERTEAEEAASVFEKNYGESNYVCSVVLVSEDKVFVGAGGGYSEVSADPALYCYDRFTFDELWKFSYPKGAGYETATGAIMDGFYLLPASNGTLYKIPVEGPGTDDANVTKMEVPNTKDHELIGNTNNTGPASITYDSGVIFFGSSNGYVYCVDPRTDSTTSFPRQIWKTEIGGGIYYTNITVKDDVLFAGAYNGQIYAIDKQSGNIIASEEVYTIERSGKKYGSVSVPVFVDDRIFMSFSDGNGMNTVTGGIAIYEFSKDSGFNQISKFMDFGLVSNFLLPVESDDFTGIYFTSMKVPLGRMSIDGEYEKLGKEFGTVKAGLILLNGESLFLTEYKTGGYVYELDLDGNDIGRFQQPKSVAQWDMSGPAIIGNYIYKGTDGGFFSTYGDYVTEDEPEEETSSWIWLAVIIGILLIIFIALLAYIKKTKGAPPISYIRGRISKLSGFNNERLSKTKQNKRRLLIVLCIGVILSFVLFLCCLSFGPSGTLSLGDAFSALISAISKHGEDLTYNEIIVYESRLPRAIAAVGVGMGLAIAGAIYQAIIRNPLVDPYIMGVSSGAGTLAVAALVANFTFFGVLEGTNFSTPILAIFGGLTAFFLTMLIAEKAGRSSTNYVLAGVVVGLAFSSIMTIMLVTAQSAKLHGALSWLYGSFANISWETAWLVFFPALFLSMVPLLWAKELNLVLLGADQAQQMGLNVKKFNRWMLILASVLTSMCVAFVGIIGFVGLVVPHVCRMILGGDHRLVLPSSIVLGACLMLFSDLLARMIMVPQELPVGAITTIIGIPLFAYLLIKKGRMYDG